jgi:hypothetical protein
MAWSFRKSIKLAPGVRLNLGKRGAGVSVGRRGLRLSANTRRQRSLTASLLGLVWRKKL